jgi:hypothetical protein
MTPSRIPPEQASFTSPIIDYEPPPVGVTQCPPPLPAALHRRTPRPLRPVASCPVRDPLPPQAVIVFADAALRRVLEVIDRRRPCGHLRPVVAPVLIDPVVALARTTHSATATLRRVRLRMVDDQAAEVFASYTRGPRVRAIAARVERYRDGWRIVALQIG